jgi:hypothetical protein
MQWGGMWSAPLITYKGDNHEGTTDEYELFKYFVSNGQNEPYLGIMLRR